MNATETLKQACYDCHRAIFGPTPLQVRIDDIYEEAEELRLYTDEENLKEEASDLLSSLFCLAYEKGWTIQELVQMNLDKMA